MSVDVKEMLDFTVKTLGRTFTGIEKALDGECDIGTSLNQNAAVSFSPASTTALEPLIQVIHKVSCELQCKWSNDYISTMMILEILENYSWDAKAVITIAAFAMIYDVFGLLVQLNLSYPLAKYAATLPDIVAQARMRRSTFNSIKQLMETAVALLTFMVRLNNLDRKYVSNDRAPLSNALAIIHEPAYCIIFSVVVCSRHITNTVGFSTSTLNQIQSWNTDVLESVQRHLSIWEVYIDEQIRREGFTRIHDMLENDPSQEEILRVLFSEDESTLIGCSGKEAEWKKILGKTVLILISSLDICWEEINALAGFYKKWQAQSVQLIEMLWFPILEDGSSWNDKNLVKFNKQRELMSWCTIQKPSQFKADVVSYVKQVWKYSGRTNLVAIDSSGKVQSKNGLDTLWMWGDKVSYFTKYEEKALWEEAKTLSTVEIIFGGIDSSIDFSSAKTGNTLLCFYGGDDMRWIEKFSETTKNMIARKLFRKEENSDVGSKLKLIYVGKSSGQGKVKENISQIKEKKISESWSDSWMWLFWSRLKSIVGSNRRVDEGMRQRIVSHIVTLLSFDANTNGWAVFTYGDQVLKIFDTWRKDEQWGRETALLFPELGTKLQGNSMQCDQYFVDYDILGGLDCYCTRSMKKSYIYSCCHNN